MKSLQAFKENAMPSLRKTYAPVPPPTKVLVKSKPQNTSEEDRTTLEPPETPRLAPKALTGVLVGAGLPPIKELVKELREMTNILMGREDPPINRGLLTLMETAAAYHARAFEIELEIHRAERERRVLKNSDYYKFRTGELRDFIELSKSKMELGSRRITDRQNEIEEITKFSRE